MKVDDDNGHLVSELVLQVQISGDGTDDVAVGAPFEDVNNYENAGVVHIFYGGNESLTEGTVSSKYGRHCAHATGDRWFVAATVTLTPTVSATSLLAPGEYRATTCLCAGGIVIIYGSANGLTSANDHYFHTKSRGIGGNLLSVTSSSASSVRRY